ncbi:DMT family transporter [Nonomuraea rhizosphaerae]|uniref:DMT family transporter n=1 Tax=Nonomuraea rhizosphaerae TaxID=2665663 RepID=UPI001C5E2C84|nr:EamA family transporter [Nonomuraea rhizosphaerae]
MTKVVPPLFVVMWSSAFIAGVIGVGSAPPLLLIFARFALAGLLLGAFALAVRAPWPRGRQLVHVIVSGILVQAVQFSAFYAAIDLRVPAAVVALVQGLNPVLIALVAGRLLGERVTPRQWLGFGLGAAGVGLAVADRLSFSPAGVLLCVAGLLALSLGTVYQKRYAGDMDVRTGTATQFLISAPLTGAASLVFETPRVTDWPAFSGAVAWLVLVNSVGAFLLLNTMLKNAPASRVSTVFFLTPPVTAVMAWLLVGQALHPLAVAGLLVGGAGVLLANLTRGWPTRGRRPGSPATRYGSGAATPESSPVRT